MLACIYCSCCARNHSNINTIIKLYVVLENINPEYFILFCILIFFVLGQYYFILLVFTTFATVMAVIVLKLHHRFHHPHHCWFHHCNSPHNFHHCWFHRWNRPHHCWFYHLKFHDNDDLSLLCGSQSQLHFCDFGTFLSSTPWISEILSTIK